MVTTGCVEHPLCAVAAPRTPGRQPVCPASKTSSPNWSPGSATGRPSRRAAAGAAMSVAMARYPAGGQLSSHLVGVRAADLSHLRPQSAAEPAVSGGATDQPLRERRPYGSSRCWPTLGMTAEPASPNPSPGPASLNPADRLGPVLPYRRPSNSTLLCWCVSVVQQRVSGSMDAGGFAAVGEKLDAFVGQVFSSFPRSDQRATGGLYLRGLMLVSRV